ncbi:hypothetical protein OAI88_01350 [Nitrosopumilus sp.]|nr:hypothetical protein [Nitrosopumilus sp.]
MKVSGFLAFTLLSISILSFGLTGAVNAQQSLPISVNTDSSTYTTGSTIEISGLVKTLAEFEQPVVLMIVSPDGNIVTIQQVMPDSDGFYSATVKAGGTMNSSGEFEIRAQYGAEKITGTFDFITSDPVSTPVQTEPVVVTPEPVVVTPEPVVVTPEPVVEQMVNCGPGTESVNGVCQVIQTTEPEEEEGGGCLIATAAYGSELAPQVQMLREIRDNQLMNTESGSAFMTTFNEAYYSFSPYIADLERESPIFKEIVKAGLTPMLSTLTIMESAESESEVLGLGLSVIALNIGMYIAAPALIAMKVNQQIRSRI